MARNSVDPPIPQRKGFVYSRLRAACWLILIHELLERFAFYGMKGLLTLFMTDYLKFQSGVATSIYHLFTAATYLLPVAGAVISDNYLGRYKTVTIFGVVYVVGLAILALSTLGLNTIGPLLGLFVISIGAGLIKPCVAAFGGDQTPENDDEATDAFFSLFYVCINVGAFISQFTTPILKEKVQCVGNQCYPLAFGVPALVMLLTYVIFVAGKPLYRIVDGEDSVFVRSVKLIGHSISRKFRLRKTGDIRENFLDYGDDLYDRKFIDEVKIVVSVLFLYLPFPIFWALFDQQGSRWSVQAAQMDGQLTESIRIYPEQMQMINPLLVIIIIPIFNNIVYPLLTKCNLMTRPPTRMVVGYIFAALSFIYAGFLQFQIQKAFVPPVLPAGVSSVRFINLGSCNLTVSVQGVPRQMLHAGQLGSELKLPAPSNVHFEMSSVGCSIATQRKILPLNDKSKYTIGVAASGSSIMMSSIEQNRTVMNTGSLFRFMGPPSLASKGGEIELVKGAATVLRLNVSQLTSPSIYSSKYHFVSYGSYSIIHRLGNSSTEFGKIHSQTGFIGTIALLNKSKPSFRTIEEVVPQLLTMPLQVPQYVLMTIGEVLFSVTSMSFAYSEAPSSMKAIMQSVYLVTIFFGNIIVTLVASLPAMPNQAWEFILFAVLVIVAGVLQGFLAYIFTKNKNKRVELSNQAGDEVQSSADVPVDKEEAGTLVSKL